MADEMRGALVLQQELEKAKFRLKDVNENIKKITGRDPEDPRVPQDRRMMGNNDGRGRERIFNMARQGIGGSQDGPPAKRRVMMGGAFSRLGPMPARRHDDSGDEDEDLKHTVQSSVVAASIETRTKSIEKQSRDREGMARNKRMFGMILGTLQRFKSEAKDNRDKDDQRRKLEKKLEDKAEKEKLRVKQETRNLLDEMRLEQSKIRRLEQKMELVQEHEAIEVEMAKLSNFLCTKAKPTLFYIPKKKLPADDVKLKASVVFVQGLMEEKKEKMEREIEEMVFRENEREERIRSRIAERSRQVSGDDEEEDEDHHENETVGEHEDDQSAINAHKASLKQNKENVVKKEPGSDNEFNIHGEDIKAEEKSGEEPADDDVEMGEDEFSVMFEGEGKGDKRAKTVDNRGSADIKPEIDEEDGGMVNTVGGSARAGVDKDSHKLSRNKSSDTPDKPKKSDRRKSKSGRSKDDSSRTDRDKHKSSDHPDRERIRSRSKEKRDKHRHSRHHKDEKRKRPRHDSDDDDEVPKATTSKDVTSKSVSEERLPVAPETDSSTKMDISTIELPPGQTVEETLLTKQYGAGEKYSGDNVVESQEERARKIVMAEDGEDVEDEPADE